MMHAMEGTPSAEKKPAKPKNAGEGADEQRRKLLRWGVVGLAVVVALVAWIATRDGGDDASSESTPAAAAEAVPPRIVDADELGEVSAELDQPVYWAGPIEGRELQLTELGGSGGVQIAYVPEGTEAGKGKPGVLTIGSYPLPDPEAAVQGFAERKGSTVREASDGREVVSSAEAPSSVYFAAADNSVQVEVYDPSAGKAMALALSGKVEPAG